MAHSLRNALRRYLKCRLLSNLRMKQLKQPSANTPATGSLLSSMANIFDRAAEFFCLKL